MSPSAAEEGASGKPQTPAERLLSIGVYAPIGLLTSRDEVVQDLAARGRKQLAFSRSLGRAALKAIAAGRGAAAATAGASSKAASVAPTATVAKSKGKKTPGKANRTPAKAKTPTKSKAGASASKKASKVAIADYEALTAREIIVLIGSCSPAQRAWISSAERSGKGRVTVLRALQSG